MIERDELSAWEQMDREAETVALWSAIAGALFGAIFVGTALYASASSLAVCLP